jgi:hypothetical protein
MLRLTSGNYFQEQKKIKEIEVFDEIYAFHGQRNDRRAGLNPIKLLGA